MDKQLHGLITKMESLNNSAHDRGEIDFFNKQKIMSSTQAQIIMIDHQPFDFRTSTQKSQILVGEIMSKIFKLRDKVQTLVKIVELSSSEAKICGVNPISKNS